MNKEYLMQATLGLFSLILLAYYLNTDNADSLISIIVFIGFNTLVLLILIFINRK